MNYPFEVKTITSPFGKRGSGFHSGVDFPNPMNSDITLMDKVKLVYMMYDYDGYGFYMVFDSMTAKRSYLFAHLNSISTGDRVGDVFEEGTKIRGITGNSGRSTGPHTHFEIRECYFDPKTYFKSMEDGRKYMAVDPMKYLSEPEPTENIYSEHTNEPEDWKKFEEIIVNGSQNKFFTPEDQLFLMEQGKYFPELIRKLIGAN